MNIIPIPAFADNYIWLIDPDHNGHTNNGKRAGVFIVDPGAAAPVMDGLQRFGLSPLGILITHHHYDHIGAIEPLLHEFNIPVYGPARGNIPALSHALHDDDMLVLSRSIRLRVMETPGHTADHIVYYGAGALFCGDTLFAGGCGRITDGTAAQLYASLQRIARLPRGTRVYCAHEYTLANLEFAIQVEPDNLDLQARLQRTAGLRREGRCTLPSTIHEEKLTNPFLRCHLPSVHAAAEAHAGRNLLSPEAVFAVIRYWKDGM